MQPVAPGGDGIWIPGALIPATRVIPRRCPFTECAREAGVAAVGFVEGPDGERVIHKTVRSGGSFGASPLRQEIGLGAAGRILRVEIARSSGGPEQRLDRIEVDRHYLVREGDVQATPIPLRRLELGTGRSAAK